MSKALFIEVLLDQNLAKPLDYAVPEVLRGQVQVGMRVEVPLKNSLKKGTVAAVKEESKFPSVKPLARLLFEQGEISGPLWKLALWMSNYYCAPLQRVLRCLTPPNVRNETKEKTELFVTLGRTHAEAIQACAEMRGKHPSQAQVLERLLKGGIFLSELMAELKISRSPVDSLVKKNWLKLEKRTGVNDLLLEEDFFPTKAKVLNGEQEACLEAVKESLAKGKFAAHLIYGITGSGKTEIYLQAIQAALDQKKSAILLVPEISLTSQTIERFRSRFSQKIAILHHRRSLGERTTAWKDLRSKETMIVIGARSAIFCPAQNLGLIIIDEEHDSSYKQTDEIPCYQGRDVAVMRASLENCVILLGSATPSIESRYNAEIGKYTFHTLSTRATSASLPKVEIVDMKQAFERRGGFSHFSDELLEGMKERVKKGEQTLLFLNKRGYHRMQICKTCREIVKCPHCDLSLTFHREAHRLECHLCNFQQPAPRVCPQCQSPESLEFKGFGTEHVERSLHAIFPEIRTLRMDRDTTQKKNSHEELFKQFRAHKADVLIGTQMIAKGFHFSSVTLVGILNPDATLSIPDFRSPEQIFQLLTQVAGRSGRSELPGEVIIQTFLPDHPTIRLAAAQDYPAFYASEIAERRQFGYPPFCHLVKLLFSSPNLEEAQAAAQGIYNQLSKALPPNTQLLPVTPAGHPKIKDRYRFQFIIKTLKINHLYPILFQLKTPSPNIELKIDVDPLSTFF
ncbi:MAG TPA: primosomal protein N' [Chlamydiales bacterium]|nr:primosomal protein N' [Chlamydiales bacterium]